jgi:predicted ATPase/DNA-binding winged helix-turn-helix (wHTH) protein/class 3 adenylate cyclase
MIYFGPFTFDPTTGSLWRGGALLSLLPKDAAVLAVLVQHAGQVVLKETLLEAVWPETYVTETVLKNSIARLRRLLGDQLKTPHYIETRARRGYRFLAAVETRAPVERPAPSAPAAATPLLPSLLGGPQTEVGASATPAASPLASPVPPGPVPVSSRIDAPASVGVESTPAAMTERRHLTVLSCVLADTDTLAWRLDPEDHYDLMQTFRVTCREIVASYDGYVAQQLDDGVLVYFGYPQAHEDDAQRAVRSGLALVERLRHGALGGLSFPETRLAVRVGIATGMMIMGTGQALDAPPSVGVGSASSLAVRLGALALPGMVVISAATAQMVEGYFVCKALEDVESNAPGPLMAYHVLGESTLRTRLDVGAARGLTPFVGREAEVALLQERWTYAHEGLGQVVLVQGEAGLGKSRLVQAWKEQVGDALLVVSECRCSPYHQHTAFYPLIELLQRALYSPSVTSPAARLERLETWLRLYHLAQAETVSLLADLLSLPLPVGRYAPLTLTPQRQRERTLETLLSLGLAQAATAPVLLVVEDVHWADPSTLEFLCLLLDQVASESMLVVLTARPGFEAPWRQRSAVTPVVLNRLTRAQTERMIVQITGGKPFPVQVMQLVVEKTDGVPLFVEELTRMVLESGQLVERDAQYELKGPLAQLTIPATLHDLLMARLDRLERGKAIAQWGAVLGREFSYAQLEAVTPYDEAMLRAGLEQLVEAELVFQRGLWPQTRYRFKHALIQEAAYDSLVKRRRQAMHAQVARGLEAHFQELVETQPEVLAQHYTEAGLNEPAVRYWQRAGQRAIDRSAHAEAIRHVTTGIALLHTLPETPERTQQAVTLHITLGAALLMSKGQAAPEVEQAYSQAYALCQQMGETPELVPALFGLWRFYIVRPQLHTARELGETLLHLAQRAHDPALAVVAPYALGVAWLYLGALPAARLYLEEASARYTPDQYHAPVFRMGVDPGVSSRSLAAMTRWLLGYPAQTLAHIHEALALAHELPHPYSLAYTRCLAARVSQLHRDVSNVYEQAEAAVALATEQNFPVLVAWGTIFRGWALALQGQGEAGMAQVRQGLAAYRATQAALFTPYFCTLLADVAAHLGYTDEGLAALAEAHTLMEQHEERWWEAEVYRLRGVLLLRQPGTPLAEAEVWLQRALDVARRQEAKALELRAAMSLSRLWQQQGKQTAAHELLAQVYDWFTEGFDTADLQEAKALLVALS